MFLIQGRSAMCAAPTIRTSLVSLFRRKTRDYDKTFQWKKKQPSTCLADRTRSKWIITKVSKSVQCYASETNEAPTNPQQGDQQDEAVVMSLEELIIDSLADRCIELGITPTITPGQSKHLDWVRDLSINEQGLMRRALACSDLDAVVKLALGVDQEVKDCFNIIATILDALFKGSYPLPEYIKYIPERCKSLVAALEGMAGSKDKSWKGLVEISASDVSPRLRILVDVQILMNLMNKLAGMVKSDPRNPTGPVRYRGRMVFDSTIAVLSVYGFAPFIRQPGTSLHQAAMELMTAVASGTLEISMFKANRGSAGDPSAAQQAVLDLVFKHQYLPDSHVISLVLSRSAESSSDMRTSLAARIADVLSKYTTSLYPFFGKHWVMRYPDHPISQIWLFLTGRAESSSDMRTSLAARLARSPYINNDTTSLALMYLLETTHSALMLLKIFEGKASISAAEASMWLRLLVDTWMTHGDIYRDNFTGLMRVISNIEQDERLRFPSCLSALYDLKSSSPGTVDLGALVLVSLKFVAGVKNTELRVKALAHIPEFLNDLSLGHFPYFYPSDLLQLMFSIMENSSPKSDGKDISYSSQYLQALVHVLSSSFIQPWLNSKAAEGDRLRVADIISKCILSVPSLLENDPSLITSTPIMRDNNVIHLAHQAYQLSGLTGALTPEAYSRVIADTARTGNILYLKEYLFDYLHSITNHPQRSHDQHTSKSVHKSSFSLEEGLLSITQNLSASILPELLHGCPSRQYHCDICSGLLSASITSVSASWTLASLEAIDNICANDRTHNKLIITPSQVSSLAKSFLSGGIQKKSSLDSEGQYDATSIGYKAALLAFKIMLDEEDRQLKAAGADVRHSSPYPILRELPSGLAPTSRHLLSQALLYNRDSQFDHLRCLCLQLSPTQQTAVALLTEYCERNADPSCSTSKSIMAVEMAHQILTAQLPLTNTDTGQRLTCQDKAKSTKGGRQADVQTSCTEESFHAYWKVVETAVCIANRCCMHTASLLLLIQFMRQFGRLRHGEAVSKALSSDVNEGTPLYTLHNRLIESIWEAVGEESFYEHQELRESSSDDHSWILVKKPIQGSPWEEDIIELKTAARLIRQEF